MRLASNLLGRRLFFRSIRTRMMVATAFLVVSTIGTVVWFWVTSASESYREQKRIQARSIAVAVSQAMGIELSEQNWSSLRVRTEKMLQDNSDFVYAIISDLTLQNQIVAAAPNELAEQYVPDLVPLSVTQAALIPGKQSKTQETYLLRHVEFPAESIRAYRGERIIEVAVDITESEFDTDNVIGTFRVGISLSEMDRAIATVVSQALIIGTAALGFGLLGAYILAQHLSEPVLRLKASVSKIAAGDLEHRADIDLLDEIGALAHSFNEMSVSLQESFGRLQKTLESFERFVPNKFLQAIAPRGIENIQVGESSTRSIAILFADIRNYTNMSEQLTPLEVFAFLNCYLACMGQVIEAEGGFIDKYIGDAIMALFDQPSTDGAVRAAIRMQQALVAFNHGRMQEGFSPIEIGIGIHYGEVVMGTVGFTSRIESTVIGDSVNLAARVEGLTKQYACYILITDDVVTALKQPEQFQLELVDQAVKVRGKGSRIALYEVELSENLPEPERSPLCNPKISVHSDLVST